MGDATEFYERLTARPLTARESEQRARIAELSGPGVEITDDRRLVKRDRATEAPRELAQVPARTWD